MLTDARKSRETVHAGHRQVEEHDVGLQTLCGCDRLRTVLGLAYDVEALLREQRGERVAGEGGVVNDQDTLGHAPLIGRSAGADKRAVDHRRSQTYRSWLLGEILLVCLLACGTALFAASDSLKSAYHLHDARLASDTAVAVVATFVCVLTSVRFLVEGRTLDLLLAGGFWSIALGTVAFGLVPVLDGGTLGPSSAWKLVGAGLLGAGRMAIAPSTDGRMAAGRRALVSVGVGVAALLVLAAGALGISPTHGPSDAEVVAGSYVRIAATLLTALWL